MDTNELNNLLDDIYTEICKDSVDLIKIKNRLIELLSFLCTPEGRTNENCKYVDSFFCLKDNWFNCIERLPNEMHDILFDIGGTLHDAIKNPEIAKNFQSLPEQLLERVKKLNV